MERKAKEIAERFKDNSREELEDQILTLRAELRVEKLQSTWLDKLADDMRDGDDTEDSDQAYKDYKEDSKKIRESMKENYGLEF